MINENSSLVECNLLLIAQELNNQPEIERFFPIDKKSYVEQMADILEFIDLAGEYALAYESIVSCLEKYPFKLSGLASVKLLEVGLLLGFKTNDAKDLMFDLRNR